MKMRSVVISLAVLMVSDLVLASSRVPIPTLDDLATVWVGSTVDAGLEYFRLELATDGTGVLIVQYLPKEKALGYKVTRTTLQRYKVTFETVPIDSDAEPVSIRGEATPGRLTFDVAGTKHDWKRTVILQRHSALMERLRAVTERAASLSASANGH